MSDQHHFQRVLQRELLINAPLTHVWQLVATEEGLRQWWGNPIALEAKEGGRCEEWRPARGNTLTHWRGIVTLYAPPHQLILSLRAQSEDVANAELTTIAIALDAEGEQTRVQVTQRAFAPAQAISAGGPQLPQKGPQWGTDVPLAQLTQPAPGAKPQPTPAAMPTGASHAIPDRTDGDDLIQKWQVRLAALSTACESSQQT